MIYNYDNDSMFTKIKKYIDTAIVCNMLIGLLLDRMLTGGNAQNLKGCPLFLLLVALIKPKFWFE